MNITKIIYQDQLGGGVTRLDVHLEDGTVIGILGVDWGVDWPEAVFMFASDPEEKEIEPDQSLFLDDFKLQSDLGNIEPKPEDVPYEMSERQADEFRREARENRHPKIR